MVDTIRLLSPISSCFQTVKGSKATDFVLIIGFLSLLIIGILASAGVFQSIGTTKAAYLSYGIYAGAAFFLIAEIIKLIVTKCRKQPEKLIFKLDPNKSINDQITKIEIGTLWTSQAPFGTGSCKITFANSKTVKGIINAPNAYVLIKSVDRNKCSYEGSADYPDPENFAKFDIQARSEKTAQQVIESILYACSSGYPCFEIVS